jgi:hypothetical protein
MNFSVVSRFSGFITKFEDDYECELCKKDKQTYWKSKKNASFSSVVCACLPIYSFSVREV